MQARWDEELTGAFGRMFPQNRRFHFPETVFVHEVPDRFRESVPEFQDVAHPLAPQVEVAIFEPHPFVNRNLVSDREGEGLCVVEDFQRFRVDFNLARREFRVFCPRGTADHFASNFQDPLIPNFAGSGHYICRTKLWVKHALNDPTAVAQVNKHDTAMVTNPVHPTAQGHCLTDVAWSQFSTMVGLHHPSFTCPFVACHLFIRAVKILARRVAKETQKNMTAGGGKLNEP
jgi:hypothetical protein